MPGDTVGAGMLESLRRWGCNTDVAMERMMGERELYLSLLDTFAQDPVFDELDAAVAAGDTAAAFEKAHMLKGVAGNLELTPMYEAVCTLVELLRSGTMEGAPELMRSVNTLKCEFVEMINENSQR